MNTRSLPVSICIVVTSCADQTAGTSNLAPAFTCHVCVRSTRGVASWKMSALGKTCTGTGIDANRSKKMKFSNEVMCPHCDKKVALKTFKKHERLYLFDNEWITKASVFMAVPAEESIEPQGNCTTLIWHGYLKKHLNFM